MLQFTMADPVSTLQLVMGVVFGGLVLLLVWHYSPGWRGASKSGARLPKGSLGWPIIGDSLPFARNPEEYVKSRVKRYGSIFKCSVMRMPMVIGTTPEFARFILRRSNLFVGGSPASVAKIIGPKALAHIDGRQHMALKKIFQKPLLPESVRSNIDILEGILLRNLTCWTQLGTVIAREATLKLASDVAMYLLLGVTDINSTPEQKAMLEHLITLHKAASSLPVNIPGTAFSKGLKAKAALRIYFKSLLEKRKTMKNTQTDMLGVLSAAQDDPLAREEVKDLDDETVSDNLVFLWFGLYETTSLTLTWVMKFLIDNPDIFRRLQAEQEEIYRGRDLSGDEPRITWADTRKMVFAKKFFQEVQRTLSIPVILEKRTTQDVEYEGYLIPKGWGVAVSINFLHTDPALHFDPKIFNPDRFDVTPKPFTYLPFSAGPHMCPGIEFAKTMSLMSIHHLTTTYTFESLEPDQKIEYASLPVDGYPISFRRRN